MNCLKKRKRSQEIEHIVWSWISFFVCLFLLFVSFLFLIHRTKPCRINTKNGWMTFYFFLYTLSFQGFLLWASVTFTVREGMVFWSIHLSASSHHDEVVILSSGTLSYLQMGYKWKAIRTDVWKDRHPVVISRKEILEAPGNVPRVL